MASYKPLRIPSWFPPQHGDIANARLGLRCRFGWHSWYLDCGCADRCHRCLRWRHPR